MNEEKTIVYSYNKDTKTYTINDKEMQKINRKLKERFTLRQENKQLQNNWNELKKWLIQLQKFKGINQQGFSWGVAQEVIDKMQELEGNNDSRRNRSN